MDESSLADQEILKKLRSVSQDLDEDHRFPHLHGLTGTMGEVTSEVFTNGTTNCKQRLFSQKIKVSTEDKVQLWWWACPSNMMLGQTLTPFKTEVSVFTDVSKEGLGACMNELMASGMCMASIMEVVPHKLARVGAIRRALVAFKEDLEASMCWVCTTSQQLCT